ncbi:MAG: class I SAM-dependent methyltransferase [Sulfurisoma sp.]|nr:class I SAM-dependent methyltransferase [Sulfurisoma sp.]
MFLEHIDQELRRIESRISESTSQDELLRELRHLGLEDFGLLLISMPNPAYPGISRILPRMAADDIQRSWTGNSGETLLKQTCAFVRSVAHNFCRFTGKTLDNANILDFGCGYGRIARLMYHFSDTDKVVGVDPWQQSIDICHADGLGPNFLLSEYLPQDLPVGDRRFDLIYAFSVFTHLSERATRASMQTLLRYLKPDGLLVITIRPVEYWFHDPGARQLEKVQQQIDVHREKGFSFLPHNRPAVDGDITYGDTSMTFEWIRNAFPDIEVLGTDRSMDDALQSYVFLRRTA